MADSLLVKTKGIVPKPYPLSLSTKVQMLGNLAMYWDGQWFLKTVDAFGLEAGIALNARVRTAFGRIEMRTMLKAVGKERADDLADALRLIFTHSRLLLRDAAHAEVFQDNAQEARVVIIRCGAYEGAKRANLPRTNAPCIACETLWSAWLETLLPGQTITVEYPRRQGMGSEDCLFVIRTKS